MYLMRIGPSGAEKPVARIDDETYVDLSDLVDDFDEVFFSGGGVDRIRPVVSERAASGMVSRFAGERIGAPIARPHQILGIGLNYRDHAAETGQAVPSEPILFNKSPNTLIGPNDDVRIPRGSGKTDWEVELGIVIGRRTSYLDSVHEAREAIAGYTVVNDVSERAFQIERSGQWVKGKSAETFNPAGPWLVTPDEIDDVLALDLWLDVNGVRRQTGSTATMVFDPYFLVHYLSQFLVLEAGDLIDTGTPPGVGMGFTPPVWLQPGDVMELGITGRGRSARGSSRRDDRGNDAGVRPDRTGGGRGAGGTGPGGHSRRGGRRGRAGRGLRHRRGVLHRGDGLPPPGTCLLPDSASGMSGPAGCPPSGTAWTSPGSAAG